MVSVILTTGPCTTVRPRDGGRGRRARGFRHGKCAPGTWPGTGPARGTALGTGPRARAGHGPRGPARARHSARAPGTGRARAGEARHGPGTGPRARPGHGPGTWPGTAARTVAQGRLSVSVVSVWLASQRRVR